MSESMTSTPSCDDGVQRNRLLRPHRFRTRTFFDGPPTLRHAVFAWSLTDAHFRTPRRVACFHDLQKFPKRDRDAITLLIDSVLARGDVEQRLKRHAASDR